MICPRRAAHPASQTPKAGHLLPHPTASFVICLPSTVLCPPVVWHLQRPRDPGKFRCQGWAPPHPSPSLSSVPASVGVRKHLTPIHQVWKKGLLPVRQDKRWPPPGKRCLSHSLTAAPYCLEECLAHSWCSRSVCWVNEASGSRSPEIQTATSAGPSCQTGSTPLWGLSLRVCGEVRCVLWGSSKYKCVRAASEMPSPLCPADHLCTCWLWLPRCPVHEGKGAGPAGEQACCWDEEVGAEPSGWSGGREGLVTPQASLSLLRRVRGWGRSRGAVSPLCCRL